MSLLLNTPPPHPRGTAEKLAFDAGAFVLADAFSSSCKVDDERKGASSPLGVLADAIRDDWERIPDAVKAFLEALAKGDNKELRYATKMTAVAGNNSPVLSACCSAALEFATIKDFFDGVWAACKAQARSIVYERVALALFQQKTKAALDAARQLMPLFFDTVDAVAEVVDAERPMDPKNTRHFYEPIARELKKNRNGRFPPDMFRQLARSRDPAVQYELNMRPKLNENLSTKTAVEQSHLITHGLLAGVLGDVLFLGGGAGLSAVTRKKPHDFDIFVVVRDDAQELSCEAKEKLAKAAMERGLKQLLANVENASTNAKVAIEQTPGVVTVHVELVDKRLTLKVQFIKRVYARPEQVVLSFDIDVAKWITDGRGFWCTHSAYRAARSQTFVVNPLMATYAGRYVKYVRLYGWRCVVPQYKGLSDLIGVFNTKYNTGSGPEVAVRLEGLSKSDTLASVMALHRIWDLRDDQFGKADLDGGYCAAAVSIERGAPPTHTMTSLRSSTAMDELIERFAAAVVGGWEVENPCVRMYVKSGERFLAIEDPDG